MEKSTKNFYKAPVCEVQDMECGAFMIEIGSGNTSPEESDSNSFIFEEDESEAPGHGFRAEKPTGKRSWECMWPQYLI